MDWNYFDKYEFVIDKYMPMMGEGESMASQIVTAVNKLIYKWYNDGDVFDNSYNIKGWCNDLSSYANWLMKNVEKSGDILCKIAGCVNDDDYENLLVELADNLLDVDFLQGMEEKEKNGSIYHCDGPFRWVEPYEDEYEEWEEEEEESDDEW